MKTEDYFLLYANCIPVKGVSRSIICDLHRNEYEFIPNALFDILTEHKKKSISEIKKHFENQYDEIIDEYFDFLLDKELIYKCSASFLNYFPELDLNWEYPAQISNMIIDCNTVPEFINTALVTELEQLGCQHIQFRIFKPTALSQIIEKINCYFDGSGISTIAIQIPFQTIPPRELDEALERSSRITEILFYNAPKNKIEYYNGYRSICLLYHDQDISAEHHCGQVSERYFATNIPHYTESLRYNTCLNRKVSIDINGNIKNCPSMTESFGNIENTTLNKAINEPGFKKYWNITKDQIASCKDCEFRHICTDCRAYLEFPEDQYSKPLKCGYDPYTTQWQDWSSLPMKQKALTFYPALKAILAQ